MLVRPTDPTLAEHDCAGRHAREHDAARRRRAQIVDEVGRSSASIPASTSPPPTNTKSTCWSASRRRAGSRRLPDELRPKHLASARRLEQRAQGRAEPAVVAAGRADVQRHGLVLAGATQRAGEVGLRAEVAAAELPGDQSRGLAQTSWALRRAGADCEARPVGLPEGRRALLLETRRGSGIRRPRRYDRRLPRRAPPSAGGDVPTNRS